MSGTPHLSSTLRAYRHALAPPDALRGHWLSRTGVALWRHYHRVDLNGVATELAFNLVFALIPALFLGAALVALVLDTQFTLAQIENGIWLTMPKALAQPMLTVVKTFLASPHGWLILGTFMGVVWTTSNCGMVILKAAMWLSNGDDSTVHLSELTLRGKAMVMLPLVALGLIGAFLLMDVGYVALAGIQPIAARLIGLIPGLTSSTLETWLPLRWVLGLLTLPLLGNLDSANWLAKPYASAE